MLDEATAEGVRKDRSANVSGPEIETGSVERGDGGVEENPRTETESKTFGLKEKERNDKGMRETAVQKLTNMRFWACGHENSDDGM